MKKLFSSLLNFYSHWKKITFWRPILLTLLWAICTYFGLHGPALPSLIQQTYDYSEGWEYAWSDSLDSNEQVSNWKPYQVGQDFPERNHREYIVLRNTIPKINYPQPSIFIFGLDQSTRCYLENKEIYRLGKWPIRNRNDFGGFFRYILIPLEPEYSGKKIYFRIQSQWVNIGFSHSVLIGKSSDLIFYQFFIHDAPLLGLSLISFFLCLLFLFISISLNKKIYFTYSSLYLFTSLILIYQSHLILVFSNYPILITLIGQISIPMILLLLIEISKRFIAKKDRKYLKQASSIYSLIIIYYIIMTYILSFDSNFQNFVAIPVWCSIIIFDLFIPFLFFRNAKKHTRSHYFFIFGILSLDLSNIPQILYELNFLNTNPNFYYHFGVLIFILSLAFSAYDAIVAMYKILEKSKLNLQALVKERTKKIEENQKLIIELEKKIIKKEAEDTIFADFHDNFGARLLDLKLMIKKSQNPLNNAEQLVNQVEKIAKGLRNKIIQYEDEELMQKDFYMGLRSSLFHRYELHLRRIIVKLEIEETELPKPNEAQMLNLKAIFSEIASNDLKYGISDSISTFQFDYLIKQDYFQVVFTAKTNYAKRTDLRNGKGKSTLLKRVIELGGKLQEDLSDEDYKLVLHWRI